MEGRRGRRDQKLAAAAATLFFPSLIALHLSSIPADALNAGIRSNPPTPFDANPSTISIDSAHPSAPIVYCSRRCESRHCSMPPLMRYGKYCGLLYRGCRGEQPCDSLDACCQAHDACVDAHHNDYLSKECNERFLDCIGEFRDSREPSFDGNTCKLREVVDVLSFVVQAALLVGRDHP